MEVMVEGSLLDVREFTKKDSSKGCSAVLYVKGERAETIEAQLNGVDQQSLRPLVRKDVTAKLELKIYNFDGKTRVGFVLKSVHERK